jgi:predicted transcriptional regulator of viral defense system
MDFESLLELIGDDPVFKTSMLMAGKINPKIVRLQISRWTKSGRILQLRRGLYAIAPPFQKVKPHPFLIANHLQHASYVSMQSALAFYGMIPEVVNITVSVTSGRPERLNTPLGIFEFRHIKPDLLHGYHLTDLGNQQAMVATPEKALLDLVYLQPGGQRLEFLQELRLQNLNRLNLELLRKQSELFDTPKLHMVIDVISNLTQLQNQEFEEL